MYKHYRICVYRLRQLYAASETFTYCWKPSWSVIHLHGGTVNAWRTVISLRFVDDVPVMYDNEYALTHSIKGNNSCSKANAPAVKIHRYPKTWTAVKVADAAFRPATAMVKPVTESTAALQKAFQMGKTYVLVHYRRLHPVLHISWTGLALLHFVPGLCGVLASLIVADPSPPAGLSEPWSSDAYWCLANSTCSVQVICMNYCHRLNKHIPLRKKNPCASCWACIQAVP